VTAWSEGKLPASDATDARLIVHSVNDPIKRSTHFDEERVLFLSDWHNDQSKTIVDALYSPEGYRGSPLPPPVDSVLINGLGQVNCSTVQAGVPCTQQTIPEIAVPKNKRIRFRVINTGTHAQLRLSIDNHELNLVEVDDTPVETVTAHEFPVSNGQRISVIVNTDQAGGAFWMRASVAAACIANQPELVAKAVFRYNDGSNEGTCGRYPHGSRKHSQTNAQLPTTQPWSDLVAFDSPCLDIDNTYPLVPSVVEAAPAIALGSHMFNAAAGQFISPVTGTTFTGFSFNGVPYFNKIYAPFLNEIQQGTPINSSLVANTEFDQLGAYDIIINQLDAFVSHPFHLHGRKFQLIARGEGSITSLDQHTGELMLDNPVRRDTVFIPNTSYAVLRLTTDTPGVWPIHCHIGWHLSTGKLGIIVVRPDVIPGFKNGRGWANLCKGFDPEAWGPQRRAADLPAGSRRNRLSQVV
jgi:FtsP/CotA-like multicopper oxidase with cupredoxin domain